MKEPRALDLFCGAGGASMGLHRAGFHVTGVDITPQPRYPKECSFVRDDVTELEFWRDRFDFIWASPPCQRYSVYSRNIGTSERHPDLIGLVREKLFLCDALWAIENVQGAPLRADLVLCGTMFGLPLVRHRSIETSWRAFALSPKCKHRGDEIPVYGHGAPQWHRERLGRNVTIAEKREAMGIDWMNRDELPEAIPPAYSEAIGRMALGVMESSP